MAGTSKFLKMHHICTNKPHKNEMCHLCYKDEPDLHFNVHAWENLAIQMSGEPFHSRANSSSKRTHSPLKPNGKLKVFLEKSD